MANNSIHIPVMLNEVVDHLNLQENDILIEGTAGFGGHTQAMLKTVSESGIYLGLDQDLTAITHSKSLFTNKTYAHHYHDNFSNFDLYLDPIPLAIEKSHQFHGFVHNDQWRFLRHPTPLQSPGTL